MNWYNAWYYNSWQICNLSYYINNIQIQFNCIYTYIVAVDSLAHWLMTWQTFYKYIKLKTLSLKLVDIYINVHCPYKYKISPQLSINQFLTVLFCICL